MPIPPREGTLLPHSLCACPIGSSRTEAGSRAGSPLFSAPARADGHVPDTVTGAARAPIILALSLVVAAGLVALGTRLFPPPPPPGIYPELSFKKGQITALSGHGTNESSSFKGPFRVRVTEHFLIVRKAGEAREFVSYIPRERVVWAVGVGPTK